MAQSSSAYQELKALMAMGGCPMCRAGAQSGRRFLDSLLFESVTDPDIRAKLESSLGFCAEHHRLMLTFPGERLGVAIIEQALLKEALRRLKSGPGRGRRSGWRGLMGSQPDEPMSSEPCPACRQEADAADRVLSVLLQHLAGDLDQPLLQAGGLCWPHLAGALARRPDAATQAALIAVHEAAWGQIVTDLGEFIRKRDHRFRHELVTDAEAAAIEEAMAALSGEPKREG